MTTLKFRNNHAVPFFNNLNNDFLTHFPSLFRDDVGTLNSGQRIPVNITETDNGYRLDVVAPGFEKEHFKISVENNVLTISAESKSEREDKKEKSIRSEYRFQSFKRSFTVDKQIDTEAIHAQYVNGVLTLNLPRKEEVKPQVKQINIQ